MSGGGDRFLRGTAYSVTDQVTDLGMHVVTYHNKINLGVFVYR